MECLLWAKQQDRCGLCPKLLLLLYFLTRLRTPWRQDSCHSAQNIANSICRKSLKHFLTVRFLAPPAAHLHLQTWELGEKTIVCLSSLTFGQWLLFLHLSLLLFCLVVNKMIWLKVAIYLLLLPRYLPASYTSLNGCFCPSAQWWTVSPNVLSHLIQWQVGAYRQDVDKF